ncbi:hypothetical protein [Bradyrhizobium prioriisuperbiae]|uniref:hypothetical protein n=1 Tax=Bradyrhizobium prioriisuperbiae TaxID=2854389 RepID=UPI0028F031FB|nr:hypothetical protein [Bradyrhizobium prioritasuperba]
MATWRDDIDALMFETDGQHGFCMVHRHAFRTLLRSLPAPNDCLAYFRTHEPAFQAAASAKISRKNLAEGVNFHLTSRDVARALKK